LKTAKSPAAKTPKAPVSKASPKSPPASVESPKLGKNARKKAARAALTPTMEPKNPKKVNLPTDPKKKGTPKQKAVRMTNLNESLPEAEAVPEVLKSDGTGVISTENLDEDLEFVPNSQVVTLAPEIEAVKENARKAFDAVLEMSAAKKKNALFKDLPLKIAVSITCFRVPKVSLGFFNILLPHSIFPKDADIVFVIKADREDEEDFVEDELKASLFKQKMATDYGIKLREVYTLRQFRKEFSTYEAKRAFNKAADVVLVDKSIIKHTVPILGRESYKRKTAVLAVNFYSGKDLGEEVKLALRRTLLKVSIHGNTSWVQLGTDDLTREQLVENLTKVIQTLRRTFPGGWPNISKLSVEALDLPLPIHFASGERPITKPTVKQQGRRETVEGEISTQPNKKITVYPDGKIKVESVPKEEGEDESDDEIPDDEEIEGGDDEEEAGEEDQEADSDEEEYTPNVKKLRQR
jgi:hypothetical protein